MTEKIKILFLTASPRDSDHLRLDEEVREIEKRILMATERDRFELISQWAVTLDDLQRALLRHKPHVVHFSGHGNRTRGLVLEGKFGNSQLVGKPALIKLFNILKDNVRLVVLNACYSGNQIDELAEVIDYTIGVQTAINDNAAISFAASFYQALAYGRSVREAFDLGNNCLNPDGDPKVKLTKLFVREGVDDSQPFLPELRSEPPDQPPSKLLPETDGQPFTITIEQGRRDFILMIVRIVGGIILVSGLAVIWRYVVSIWERSSRRERYAKAIDQLNSQEITVRTDGIRSLGELASDPNSDEFYERVVYNLAAFIREHSPLKKNSNTRQVDDISSDIQAALKVLGWRKHKWQDGETDALDLSSTNLKGAVLRLEEGSEGAHLEGVLLNGTNLEDAKLRGINLQDAVLAKANLRRADLSWANLQGAYLHFADLDGTNLLEAQGLEVDQIRLATNGLKAKLPPDILKQLGEP